MSGSRERVQRKSNFAAILRRTFFLIVYVTQMPLWWKNRLAVHLDEETNSVSLKMHTKADRCTELTPGMLWQLPKYLMDNHLCVYIINLHPRWMSTWSSDFVCPAYACLPIGRACLVPFSLFVWRKRKYAHDKLLGPATWLGKYSRCCHSALLRDQDIHVGTASHQTTKHQTKYKRQSLI